MQTLERSEIFSSLRTLSTNAATLASTQAEALRRNLASIDTTIAVSDAREVQAFPFGFDVHKARREYMERKSFMDYLDSVGKDGAAAMAWCAEHDIPILAILPEKVWAKVCVDAELFTLWPSPDGEVGIMLGEYERYVLDARYAKYRKKDPGGILSWIAGLIPDWRSSEERYAQGELDEALRGKAAAERFFGQSKKSLLLSLFPGYSSHGVYTTIKVRYPVPDENFGLALLKFSKARKDVGIVVEADAIDVSECVEYALDEISKEIRRWAKVVVNERVRSEALRKAKPYQGILCPILTFREGTVRVVVAQYGNWPIEMQAVQAALEQDLRITFD